MQFRTRLFRLVIATILLTHYSSIHAEHYQEWSLGALVSSGSEVYKGGDSNTQVLPVLKYESLNWSISTVRAAYHLPISQYAWMDLISAVRLQNLDGQSSKTMKGIKDRNESLDAGLSIHSFLPYIGYANLEWLVDISGVHDGHEYTLVYGYPVESSNVTVTPSVFTVYQSASLVDYYYGIKQEEVTSDRAPYKGRHTYNHGMAVDIQYKFNQEWLLESGISITRLGAGITSSPIINAKMRWHTHLAISYQF